MKLTGLNGTGPVIFRASADLATWTPIHTNAATTNAIYYVDPAGLTEPFRFYRAQEQ